MEWGDQLTGRVRSTVQCGMAFFAEPPNPLDRSLISEPFGTGIKALDTFVPMGIGQRMGIFAGSGVGKSFFWV